MPNCPTQAKRRLNLDHPNLLPPRAWLTGHKKKKGTRGKTRAFDRARAGNRAFDYLRRRRRVKPNPNRPVPSSNSDAGSGTPLTTRLKLGGSSRLNQAVPPAAMPPAKLTVPLVKAPLIPLKVTPGPP